MGMSCQTTERLKPATPRPPHQRRLLPRVHQRCSSAASVSASRRHRCPLRLSTKHTTAVRRICPFLEKKTNRANKVSFSNHKTKKKQFVNLQYKKLWWQAGKVYVRLHLSTKALKTIEKHGLHPVANKAGIDLNKK
ncbi:unnamed protein product [Alopecurus aequalis]